MGRHHHRIAIALTAALSWLPTPSFGQAPEAGEPESSVAELFSAGVDHLREGRHADAARAFREVYRMTPRVEAMCNLALTYDRWGDHVELALRAYRTCARDDETGRFRGYAERRVAEIERETALAEDSVLALAERQEEAEAADAAVVVAAAPSPRPPPSSLADGETPSRDYGLLMSGIAVGGVGAAALATAIALAISSSNTVAELRDEFGAEPPTLIRGTPEHDRFVGARTEADVATGLYVASSLVLAAGGAMIAADVVLHESESGSRVVLQPAAGGVNFVAVF